MLPTDKTDLRARDIIAEAWQYDSDAVTRYIVRSLSNSVRKCGLRGCVLHLSASSHPG